MVPKSRMISTKPSRALSSTCEMALRSLLSGRMRSTPLVPSSKLPDTTITGGRSSTTKVIDERSGAKPPRWKLEPNSRSGIQSKAATTMSVFGGAAGLMGKVGSFTLVVASPEKFLMPMNKDKRLGTSPGRLMLPGASPIIVNRALISSCGRVPEGRPRIHILASEMLPNASSPSGIFERSSK